MTRTYEEWIPLARTYLYANAGRQISGMTHNANNFCHVLEMQLELFQGKINRQPDMTAVDLLPKFGRLTQAVSKLTETLRDNEQLNFFTDETVTMIDVRQFVGWVDRFWTNNLFYKHKVANTIVCPETIPTLQLPPFLLTLAIDESLKNAVEACMDKDPAGQHAMSLDVAPHAKGVAFSLTSPTICPAEIDPLDEGTTNKPDHQGLGLPMVKFFADQVGWSVHLATTDESTTFRLEIPEQKTQW
ncbi:hypothetical protein [Desulfoplanes sp.]